MGYIPPSAMSSGYTFMGGLGDIYAQQQQALLQAQLAQQMQIPQQPPPPSALQQSAKAVGMGTGMYAGNSLAGGSSAVAPEMVGPAPELIGPSAPTIATGETLASAPAASGWTLSGFGSAGNYYAPLAGAALGADVLMNKKHGGRGAAEGALAGAGIGSTFGPVGAGVGALVGGGIGYFGNFGDKDRYLTEYNRAQKLRDQGINWNWNAEQPRAGRSKGELILEAMQTGDQNTIDFAKTRDEKYLTGQQAVGYAVNPETFGKTWTDASLDRQVAAADMLAKAGAYRESHGTLDLNSNFNSTLKEEVEKLLQGGSVPQTGKTQASTATRSKTRSPGISLSGQRISY